MSGLERLGWGRLWILETLFQIAEEHDCMIDDFRFTPTNEGELLLFNLNGEKVSWVLPTSEIEDCEEEGAFKRQIPSNQAKIKKRFGELLMLHKRVVPLGAR